MSPRWHRLAAIQAGLLATVCSWSVVAHAHGGLIKAYITIEPFTESHQPQVRVELFDLDDRAITGGGLRLSVGEKTSAPEVPLTEAGSGVYAGQIELNAAGRVPVRVEADLPGGLWIGQRTITYQPDRGVQRVLFALQHVDVPIKPLGLTIIILFGLLYVGFAVMIVKTHKQKQKVARPIA